MTRSIDFWSMLLRPLIGYSHVNTEVMMRWPSAEYLAMEETLREP